MRKPYIGWMKSIALAIAMLIAAPAAANAACSGSSGVRFGESLGSVAARCGINVQRLRDANPGLNERTLQNGAIINTPPPQLQPTIPTFRGNRSVSGAQGNPYDYHFGLPSPRPKHKPSKDEDEARRSNR